MSGAAVAAPDAPARRSTLATQVRSLAGRSVLRTLRQPAMFVPSLVFPLFLLAVNSAGLNAATQIPGFPTDSYLTFALAVPFIQGALFATMNSGQSLAEDIENGFFNRLALTPMRGSSLIAGQLGGLVVIGLFQATVYLAVGLAAGAHFEAGVARRPGPLRALDPDLDRLRRDRDVHGDPHRLRRSGPGDVPAALRPPLLQLDLDAAQPDPAGLVPDDRDDQPGQLPDRGHPQPDGLSAGTPKRWRWPSGSRSP